MQIGIIGLPQSGKTTVFNALTGSSAETGMGGAKKVNQAMVKVPDQRLDFLSKIYEPKKTTPATVNYLDLSGLGRGKISADSIDAEFLAQLRSVDAVLMVVRKFKDANIPHPHETINAVRDAENLSNELMLADLMVIEKRLERIDKDIRKTPGRDLEKERAVLLQFKDLLDSGTPIRNMEISPTDERLVKGFGFLTQKSLFILINISEESLGEENIMMDDFKDLISPPLTRAIAMSAKIESEMTQLAEEDAAIFRQDLGIKEPALNRLILESYKLLGLISFFTYGKDECRAWTIKQGTNAQKAAGEIHTDLERGFIRAEIASYSDFEECGDMNKVKTAGRQRLEGKDYIVQDGDILTVRFNV